MRISDLLAALTILIGWSGAAAASERPRGSLSVGEIVCRDDGIALRSTATLVENRRTLLTVAHFNRVNGRRMEISPEYCRFRMLGTDRLRGFTSGFTIVQTGGSPFDVRISRAADWAILSLDEPAPSSTEPLLLVKSRDFVVGQAAMFGSLEARENQNLAPARRCRLKWPRIGSVILEHDCETAPGASGSPLVIQVDNKRYLLAIHTGRSERFGIAALVAHSRSFKRALRRNAALLASTGGTNDSPG